MLLALGAAPARADIALLANGTTLKVTSQRLEGTTVFLSLKGGGEVGLAASALRGVVPDEVLDEVPPAAAPTDIPALALAAARRHHVDPGLVQAVVAVESGFRPEAVSPKGAQGLMQLMPATARALGVADAFDPAQNLDGGTRHLRALIDRYGGDVKSALAAYNAGEGAVARHRGVPPYRETRDYVRKVLRRVEADATSR
jgi:soluble lytic murein transglycosylase-like protein